MSLSKASTTPLSADEARTLTSLLIRMQNGGVSETGYPEQFGAMTDASKRRKPEFDSDLEEEFEHVGTAESAEPPKSEKPKPSTSVPASTTKLVVPMVNVGNIPIPPDNADLVDWSTTVCELPKVLALHLSYAELVADPEHMDYLIWVKSHGVKKGGRFEDLSLFLHAVGYSKERFFPSANNVYPGTNLVRKKKNPVA